MTIAVIEDSVGDISFYDKTFLKGLQRNIYNTYQEFNDSDKNYSLVILDLNLPDKFGLDLVKGVRSIFKGTIIVITGMGEDHLRGKNMHDIIEAGANDVFQKNLIGKNSYSKMIRDCIDVC